MKVLLIIVLVYFALMLAGRYLFPALLRGYIKHISKKFYNGMGPEMNSNAQKENTNKKDVSKNSRKTGKYNAHEGEYVDYEEIN